MRPLSSYRPQFGDRWITQSLFDVKYYLTRSQGASVPHYFESNSSAPYGFEPIGVWGPIRAYRNTNSFGIGAIYDSCIDRDAFEKYSPEQREALLTKAAVLAQCPINLQKLDPSGADLRSIIGQRIPLTPDRITSANLQMGGGNHIDTFSYISTTDDRQLNLDLRGLTIPNLLKIEIVYNDDVRSLDRFYWRKANQPFDLEKGGLVDHRARP